ncbi:MAG: NfeD family protein [Actinomycetota bacterium]|nr:NfeD family protein [Actinomycetota bacterium]
MPPVVWLVAGLALLGAELLTLDLLLLMLGLAALVTAGAALVVDPFALQLVVFAATSGLLLVGVRPFARRALEVRALPSGNERLIGRRATVVEPVGADAGQVRMDGELWRARTYLGGPELPAQSAAVVAAVEGATLRVYPAEL